MQLYNNTPQQLFYSIGTNNAGDCGTIKPGDTADWPYYDNQTDVQVSFVVQNAGPNPMPFTILIPSTTTGNAVTLGLFVD